MRRRRRKKNPTTGDVVGAAVGVVAAPAALAISRIARGANPLTGGSPTLPNGDPFANAALKAASAFAFVVFAIGLAVTKGRPGFWRGAAVGSAAETATVVGLLKS